jgi:NitT/TauT family transport system ATP-binding protein
MELSDAADKKPSKLSGGMRRRVALARALAYGGDILLLDEPFKGFDPALKQRILPFVVDFSKTAAVVLVTHDEQESALAETCLMIKKL